MHHPKALEILFPEVTGKCVQLDSHHLSCAKALRKKTISCSAPPGPTVESAVCGPDVMGAGDVPMFRLWLFYLGGDLIFGAFWLYLSGLEIFASALLFFFFLSSPSPPPLPGQS